jgi:hypothetical protein
MDLQSKDLFVHFDLCDKVIMYVKDKGVNLNTIPQMPRQALFHVLHWCWQD